MNIAVLYDKNAPFTGTRPNGKDLLAIGEFADVLDFNCFRAPSLHKPYDCIINLHGEYFFLNAWSFLLNLLRDGAGLISLGGGTAFSTPLGEMEGIPTPQRSQSAYHEKLNIISASDVKGGRVEKLEANGDLPILAPYINCFRVTDTKSFIVRFTQHNDQPMDNGSSGPMDASLTPLVMGWKNGRQMSAPVVLIENTKGEFRGGRWIFMNYIPDGDFWFNGGAALLGEAAAYCQNRVCELVIRTNYASYHPGEQASLLLHARNIRGGERQARIRLSIQKDGLEVYHKTIEEILSDHTRYSSIPVNFSVEKGFYTVTAKLWVDEEPERTYHNGFWGYDRELMESGGEMTVSGDYFQKDGKPCPIVGMTYMQSDVHRKFLHLPNPFLWDRDIGQMKAAGINMIRTGIWTGLRTISFVDGVVSEEIFRSADALFLTAKKHDMPIVFNFFAFTPESWEGANPYLDPRAVEAQKKFITAFTARHARSTGVSWDLINEPSLCATRTHWAPRPNRDGFEQAAWGKFLEDIHGTKEALRSHWNVTEEEVPSFSSAALPEIRELNPSPRASGLFRGLKSHDYVLFTERTFTQWAKEMVQAIRSSGSSQLVTAGQDEALNSQRPSGFFYGEAVDYTTNHSWWLNDDLYWDGIFAKIPGKPCLIQETGVMYQQTPDNRPRLNQRELRNLLERKYALAFAADNAGAIQWIWNINHYMADLNEVNIGAVFPDGTHKMEADVSYVFGDFIKEAYSFFTGPKPPETAVVFPSANSYSIRNYALPSTKKIARMLGYDFNIPFRAYGEYQLTGEIMGADKLIILTGAGSLTQKAWKTILSKIEKGGVLLLEAPFSRDEYWGFVKDRGEALGLETEMRNINRQETLLIDGQPYDLSYSESKMDWIEKEIVTNAESRSLLKIISYGQGKVVYSPFPLALNENNEATRAVYEKALALAGVRQDIQWNKSKKTGILAKKLDFSQGGVYVLVSETSETSEIDFTDASTGASYRFKLEGGRSLLFAVDSAGAVVKTLGDTPVDKY